MLIEIFKRLSSQILIDLQELEGDFRAANLAIDKAQSILYMFIISVSIIGLTGADAMLFKNNWHFFWQMVMFRGAFVLFTLLVILGMHKTSRVRDFDRLTLGWIIAIIIFLLLFNLTRPENYLTTAFDIITVFAIYVISPLRFKHNVTLAIVFTVGTLFINYSVKTGVDPVSLHVATAAQFIVHALGVGAGLQVQSYRRKSYKAFIDERDAKEMVAYLANIDPLTKSLTRRHFFNIAESEYKRFARYRRPFAVLVMDADHFKKINDTHGHHAGDIVLRGLSLVAMEQKRIQDTYGRLGGEEFGLILPETTLEHAIVVAERIRSVWEKSPSSMDGTIIHSTVSIGVSDVREDDQSFDNVLRRADLMMYKAKEQGRNRVEAG